MHQIILTGMRNSFDIKIAESPTTSIITQGTVSSSVAHWDANRLVLGLNPVGLDTLGLMLDCCFILCHKCTSPHCYVSLHVF